MQCHSNLNSGKMRHLPRQTRLPEASAADTLLHSSLSAVVTMLLHDLLTAPSWHTFTYVACGGALASDRHTMTTSVWLTRAATVKHLSCFDVFLGRPLDHKRGATYSPWSGRPSFAISQRFDELRGNRMIGSRILTRDELAIDNHVGLEINGPRDHLAASRF